MSESPARPVFDVHPGLAMVTTWRATLPETTGKTLDEWVALARAEGPPASTARRQWLKVRHQLGTNVAGWVSDMSLGERDDDPDAYLRNASDWVDAMFAGKKAALRPLFEALYRIGRALGDDVRVCPCQTIVPFYRRHVFAQVKPTTNTRVDLGLALGDTPASAPLVDTGGLAKKDRITHRIPIARASDIDATVTRWFHTAYERDARG